MLRPQLLEVGSWAAVSWTLIRSLASDLRPSSLQAEMEYIERLLAEDKRFQFFHVLTRENG